MGADELHPAVILRTRPLGESDRVIVLLTPTLGKVDAAARNARASKRRFAGGLAPGMRGRAALARPRRAQSDLLRLHGFEPTAPFDEVGRDLTRFAYVAYVCELTDQLVTGQDPEPALFAELCATLGILVERPNPPRPVDLQAFELALLRGLGIVPALDRCGVCGEPVEEARLEEPPPSARVPFSAARGGVLCDRHGVAPIGEVITRIPVPVVQAAARLLARPEPAGLRDAVEAGAPELRRALRDLSLGAIRVHLRRPLRSLALFGQLPLSAE